ncbi:MAG TPA: hypothetical protein VFV38_17595 [Ktedonobacteraceae bacterium]|nr:hypothetical protein [Ktedonobacteraceae bacterium]
MTEQPVLSSPGPVYARTKMLNAGLTPPENNRIRKSKDLSEKRGPISPSFLKNALELHRNKRETVKMHSKIGQQFEQKMIFGITTIVVHYWREYFTKSAF